MSDNTTPPSSLFRILPVVVIVGTALWVAAIVAVARWLW